MYRRFSARRFGHPPPQSGSPLAYAHSSTPVGASMRKRMRHLARAHAHMRQSRRLRRRRMAALRLRVRSGRHGSPELGDSPRVYAHASHAGPCQHTEARARGLAQERLANHRRPLLSAQRRGRGSAGIRAHVPCTRTPRAHARPAADRVVGWPASAPRVTAERSMTASHRETIDDRA